MREMLSGFVPDVPIWVLALGIAATIGATASVVAVYVFREISRYGSAQYVQSESSTNT